MVISEKLTNLLKERIKLRHRLNSIESVKLKDVAEVKGEEGSADHKSFEVLYNCTCDGIRFTHVRRIFTVEISELEDTRYTLGDKAPKADMVNSPDHYKKRYIREVIQSIKGLCTPDEYRGYLKGSKIKYLARYQDKGGIEDLEKEEWYGAELIAFEKEQSNKTQEATQ